MENQEIRFMKVNEVARFLGISKSLTYEYLQSEECPFRVLKINSRYLIPYNSFAAWYKSMADDDGRGGK